METTSCLAKDELLYKLWYVHKGESYSVKSMVYIEPDESQKHARH